MSTIYPTKIKDTVLTRKSDEKTDTYFQWKHQWNRRFGFHKSILKWTDEIVTQIISIRQNFYLKYYYIVQI